MTFKNILLSFKIEVLEIAEHVSTTFWQQFNWQVTLSGSQMNLESRSESHFQEQVALVGNQTTRGSRQWLTRWWGVTRPTGWRSSHLEKNQYDSHNCSQKRQRKLILLKCGTSPDLQLGLHPIDCASENIY